MKLVQILPKNLRAFIKAFIFVISISSYFVITTFLYPFLIMKPMSTRKVINSLLLKYSRFYCWFMGIRVKKIIEEDFKDEESYLVISNHLSYTDIIVIVSQHKCSFVTSVEIKKTPFLGQICQLAGCLFVERRSRKKLGSEVKELSDALRSGLNVVVFPEATSTNGEEVIRFKRPLFRAAIESGVNVKPVTLNYRAIDGVSVTHANRDAVFWYGDMAFASHLWGVFQSRYIDVDITVGKEIKVSENADHSELAEEGHRSVSTHYHNIQI